MHSSSNPTSSAGALPALAFFGIGLMGKPMAARLLNAGCRVHAWNRSPSAVQALLAHGAVAAATPAEALTGGVEIVVSMLADGAVVAAVMDAAAPALKTGMLWIDMSSTRQSEAQAFHARLARQGVAFVDAPVSGGVLGAEAGTLAIMAGGSEADVARAEPVLAALGRPVRVGPPGSGQLAKLCNQLIVGGTLTIVAEALLLAQAGGADPTAVRAAIRGGFAESRILDVHGQRMLERNFLPGGKVQTQLKDMDNILAAAGAAGVTLPTAGLVAEIYRCIAGSVPNADQAAALLALERMNPGVRVGAGDDRLPD